MPTLLNPLHDLHEKSEAEFQPYAEVEIVSTFGEPQAEYAAIRKASGLMDLPQRGILELTGKDRLAFLNNLVTNQTFDKATKTGLVAGQGVYAFLLSNQGRIVTDMTVLELGERTWLEMDARLIDPTIKILERYVFSEQVTFADRTTSRHEIALHGPGALAVINTHAVTPVPELAQLANFQTQIFGSEVLVWRDDECAVPGYHIVILTEVAECVWRGLVEPYAQQVNKRTLRPIGWAAYNSTRIEAGRPIFGVDFDNTILPAETGQLDRGVSFTKGCYLGQEVVARMHARNQFAKKLVGIRMEDDRLPIAGSPVFDDKQNTIGGITSSTISPVLSRVALCLGYVKKPFVEVGTVVHIPAEGEVRKGAVAKTPFIPT